MTTVRRAVAAVFAVGAALSVAGCSRSGSPPARSPDTSPPPVLATVTGTVRIYGGPINPKTGKVALNGNPMATVAPVVVKQGTRVVLQSKTEASGRYRVQVPAGSYTIAAGCSQPEAVSLTAGESLAKDLNCDVP
jgi:hypothetical protein